MRIDLSIRTLVAVTLGLIIAYPGAAVHAVPADSSDGDAATGTVRPGYENPPNADKNGRGYVNPCIGREGYEAHVSKPTGVVMNDVEEFAFDVGDDVVTVKSDSAPGTSIGFSLVADNTFQVEYVEWMTACALAEDSPYSQFETGSLNRYWIRRPTQGALVPDLLAEVVASLPAPDILWPSADPEFGWIYVNGDNDVRVNTMRNVRKSKTVRNLVGSVTAWVEASPSMVQFDPGEPNKGEISCTYASATAPYVRERATGCTYKYTNSSAISTAADNAFVARTSVSWAIASSGPLTYNNPLSWRQELVQVAEVQALVID